MIVRSILNDISTIPAESVRKRLSPWMGSDGKYTDLPLGQSFAVEAIEYLDDGIWFYLQTVEVSEHPYPYASECFAIEDSSFSENWVISANVNDGKRKLKRVTFPEWAEDDAFYEKLVDGDKATVSIYLKYRGGQP